MENCPECGKPIPEGLQYCPSCIEKPVDLSAEIMAHINLLKKKIEKEPLNAKLHLDLAEIYQKHSYNKQALSEYEKAVHADVKNFDAHIKSAYIYLKFRETKKAENAFRAALHINPKSTESLIGLFRTYYLQDRTEEAIVLCEKIVRSKPDNVEFHILLKNLYNKKGNKEKFLIELLKLESLDIDLGFQIGKYHYDNRGYDKAIEHLNGLLKLKNITLERDAMTRTYMALACLDKGDIPEAKKIIGKIQPSYAQNMDQEAQKKLASLFFKIGQNELHNNKAKKAIAFFEKALSFDKETIDYARVLDKTKNESVISNKKVLKKVSVIAVGAIAVSIFIVFVWILTHNKIIIDIEPAENTTLLIDGKSMKTKVENPGIISSPTLLMGKHDIEIEKTGYEKWQGSANIGFGKPARLKVTLVPIHFFLQLTSVPESTAVIIDGQFVGKTPFSSDRMLACPHVIEMECAGHAKWRTILTVNERDSIDLGIVRLKNLAGKWRGKIGEN
jgi:tetratricopeptide (TPR) repeat protein